VASVTATVLTCLAAASPSGEKAKVGNREYSRVGGKWYGYVDGKLGDERNTSALTALPGDGQDVREIIKRSVGHDAVAVVDSLHGFYYLRIDDSLDPRSGPRNSDSMLRWTLRR